MNTLAERVKYARELKNLSQHDIAEKAGISQPTYFKIENGLTQKPRNILDIAQALGVNPHWLATGQGEMTPTAIAPNRINEISDDFITMAFWDGDTPLDDGEFEASYYKDVEFLGGSGFENDNYDDGRRKLRYAMTAAKKAGVNPKAVICTTLKGDSMEELILDGSMIAIDRSKKELKDGKIYAFRHGNMLRVKYLIPRPDGGLIIRSHNPRYADEIITGEAIDHENIEVIGWVWNWSSLLTW